MTVDINEISVSDTPAEMAWKRMLKMKIDPDLDKSTGSKISIASGIQYPFVPTDGVHRIAMLYHRGIKKVTFTLHDWRLAGCDDSVNLTQQNGIYDWSTFVSMCMSNQFLRRDTS